MFAAAGARAGTYPVYQYGGASTAVAPGWSVYSFTTVASTVLSNTCANGGAIGDYVFSGQPGAVTENGSSGSQVGLAVNVPASAPDVYQVDRRAGDRLASDRRRRLARLRLRRPSPPRSRRAPLRHWQRLHRTRAVDPAARRSRLRDVRHLLHRPLVPDVQLQRQHARASAQRHHADARRQRSPNRRARERHAGQRRSCRRDGVRQADALLRRKRHRQRRALRHADPQPRGRRCSLQHHDRLRLRMRL